ncbi:hypothetical protein YC2023_112840 [Brassica napus]
MLALASPLSHPYLSCYSITDCGIIFSSAHLKTRREGSSVGCTSPWGLVWASAWDTPG